MAQVALKIVNVGKISPVTGDTPTIFGGFRIFTVTLPLASVLNGFRSNSNQRDTDLRSTKHLLPLQPEHLSIAVMITLTGDSLLLDGHTRLLFWKNNPTIAPKEVRVTVYQIIDASVDAKKEELRLYSSFDSRTAVKTSAHTIQSTMRSISLSMNTPWLRAGSFANALRVAAEFCGVSSSLSTEELMTEFSKELTVFDGILPKKTEFVSPFVAAAIVMLRKAPQQQVVELLASYQNNDFQKMIQNGASHSIYKLMRDYRRAGVNGNGNFPTNGADMSAGVTKFCKLIYLALTMGDTTMVNPAIIRAFTRERLKTLIIETSEIVTPI